MAAFVRAAADVGIETVTPVQVTAIAGLPDHSFYRYFDDEAACLLATYEEASAWIGAALRDAIAAGEDWASSVALAVAAALALAATDPDLTRLCAIELRRLDCAAGDRLRSDLGLLAVFLRCGRDRCPDRDRLPASFENSTLGGTLWLLGFQAARGAGAVTPNARDVTYFLLVPYLGQAEALRVAALSRPAPAR
jgi:AcrR family transcriptional regulator